MPIEKTKAFVLKTMPYRESSGIFYLLTERRGVVHGIAKGIRKKKTGAAFLERGFLIETLVYIKPHRELHTLGDIQMIDYYPQIRNDLVKGAVRDAAFETILTNVSTEFPAPELFALVAEFLAALEDRTGHIPSLLWNFFAAFSRLMGFGVNSGQCVSCKKELSGLNDIYLVVEKGGFVCGQCAAISGARTLFPPAALVFLADHRIRDIPPHPTNFSVSDERRITRSLASYCHYHCDTRADFKALEFLDSLLFHDPV